MTASDAVDTCEGDQIHMSINCDAETQWEDPSVSNHNYSTKSTSTSTSAMGTQCIVQNSAEKNNLCQLPSTMQGPVHTPTASSYTLGIISWWLWWSCILIYCRVILLKGLVFLSPLYARWFHVWLTSWKKTRGITHHGFPGRQSRQQCLSVSENISQIQHVWSTVQRHPFKR